ncbi:meiotic recombination protein spo11 [Aspergillus avenaceus]|uniref:DNA topoisomerase (ATP-hydrolyzing) n=1 Tax=Aspergillus avenaceus TaxID=36643 RepID=A0A5N6TEP9_ASPAV|nr:meiotic recombination protein spo11 [Aspergillus avenaceus]
MQRYSEAEGSPTLPHTPGIIQKYIEETLATVLEELSTSDGRPSISLRRRSKKPTLLINPMNGALEGNGPESRLIYSWPGKSAYEAWKFTVIFRVLAAIAENLHIGLVVSRRDIYYSDPNLFGTQKVVDDIVDDVAYTVGLDRSALNVEAAAKGLVVGSYQLKTSSGHVIDTQTSAIDTLVPSLQDIDEITISDSNWVLVVEKEAVYRRLVRLGYYTKALAGKGILITGKGYPDLSTRAFLRKLNESGSRSNKNLPFYALVDSDPDGMAIMSTYKYGSMAHTSENGRLNIPCLQWLGVRTSEVVAGALHNDNEDEASMSLTARDRKKIVAMLCNSPVWAVEGPEPEWRAELLLMLMLNLKAEIEILYDRKDGLERWIDQKMAGHS